MQFTVYNKLYCSIINIINAQHLESNLVQFKTISSPLCNQLQQTGRIYQDLSGQRSQTAYDDLVFCSTSRQTQHTHYVLWKVMFYTT